MVNPRKVYAIDTGLIRACSRSVQPDWGHLLENFVFVELRRRGYHVDYYRTASGHEVDFLAADLEGRTSLIQVALKISHPETRKRELNALSEAMKECGLKTGLLITLDQDETIKIGKNHIHILPAWLWALTKS